MNTVRRFTTITLRPHPCQFIIDELMMLLLCLAALVYGGMDGVFSTVLMLVGLCLLLILSYRYVRLRRTVYTITGEQLKKAEGIFTRDEGYIELYRVIDFAERRNLLQQILGLKTVTILSGDRTTPRLSLQGIPSEIDLVAIIRERVEYVKTRKPVYEITNRY